VYLGQVIHTEENGVRVHFTDASVENDVEGDEEFWTDFPPSHCTVGMSSIRMEIQTRLPEEAGKGKRDDCKNI
jgi:hypothetical protein